MTQHIHKYRRQNIGRDKPYFVMQCSLPGCTHYTPMRTKLSCPSLVGKVAKCNKCGDPFELDKRALQLAKPTCGHCAKSGVRKEAEDMDRFFSNLNKNLQAEE